jgi:hypothetical protein
MILPSLKNWNSKFRKTENRFGLLDPENLQSSFIKYCYILKIALSWSKKLNLNSIIRSLKCHLNLGMSQYQYGIEILVLILVGIGWYWYWMVLVLVLVLILVVISISIGIRINNSLHYVVIGIATLVWPKNRTQKYWEAKFWLRVLNSVTFRLNLVGTLYF